VSPEVDLVRKEQTECQSRTASGQRPDCSDRDMRTMEGGAGAPAFSQRGRADAGDYEHAILTTTQPDVLFWRRSD